MRLPIALDLGRFVERLPAHPVLGILTINLLPGERLDDREHAAIAQITVVRECEDLGAGLLFAHGHPFPQVAGIGAAERRLGGVRLDEAGLRAIVPEDDVPVQVVALVIRGPLIADERGEPARLVRLVRCLDRLLPRGAIGRGAGQRKSFRHLASAEAGDDVDRGLRAFAGIDLVIPFTALRCRQQPRVAADQLWKESESVGVISHDLEVEWPRKFHALSAGRHDLLAFRKTIRVLRPETATERACVHRERRVRVRVAEKRARGEIASRVRRVRRLRGKHLRGGFVVERADVGRLRERRGPEDGDGETRERQCFDGFGFHGFEFI